MVNFAGEQEILAKFTGAYLFEKEKELPTNVLGIVLFVNKNIFSCEIC